MRTIIGTTRARSASRCAEIGRRRTDRSGRTRSPRRSAGRPRDRRRSCAGAAPASRRGARARRRGSVGAALGVQPRTRASSRRARGRAVAVGCSVRPSGVAARGAALASLAAIAVAEAATHGDLDCLLYRPPSSAIVARAALHHDESLAPHLHRRRRRRAPPRSSPRGWLPRSAPPQRRARALDADAAGDRAARRAGAARRRAAADAATRAARRCAKRSTAIDGAIAGLPPRAQDELGQLFALLALAAGALVARARRASWREASRDDVARFLDRLRDSRSTLLRAAYDALHQLVFAAWYGNPRAWPAIGYPGPPRARHERRERKRRRARSAVRATIGTIADPIAGVARGWNVIDASRARATTSRSRPTSSSSAPAPAAAPRRRSSRAPALRVVLLEEGPLRSSRDFRMREARGLSASSTRNRRRARRATRRSTSCRAAASAAARRSTGRARSARRRRRSRTGSASYGLARLRPTALAPWFARMEARLVDRAVGRRAEREQRGARARRRASSASRRAAIRRNVKGCWNLGYCGMGCPTNAKQSMLVTTIPARARPRRDARHARARAARSSSRGDRVDALECARDGRARHRADGAHASPCARAPSSRPRGAIGTPALLLRSGVPDPHGARRQAHVPASDGRLGRADAGARRRLRRRAADRSTPITSSTRCRSTARSASSSRRRRCIRCSPRSRCPATASRTRAGCASFRTCRSLIALMRDGFHPESAGRHGAPARRRHAGARLSARRRTCGTACGARSRDGRDPVRRRRDARSCRCMATARAFTSLARRARRDRGVRPAPLVHAASCRAHVMGGCAARRRSAPRGRRRDGPPSSSRATCYVLRRFAVSDVDRRQSAAVDLRRRRRRLADGARAQRSPRRVTRRAAFSVIALTRSA